MARYILLPLKTDPRDLAEVAFDYLREHVPGIELADGHAETLLVEANAHMAADVLDVLSGLPAEMFRYFGRSLAGLPPYAATLATGTVTIRAADALGHTLEDGLELYGFAPDGTEQTFRTVGPAVIPAGQAVLGGITVEAIDEGAGGNGVTGNADLLGRLDWISSVTFDAPTSGGRDGEADDAYLDRLAEELRLMAPRPILPGDFAVFARRIPGVARCLAIDGLDPVAGTLGNPRMVTLFPVDAAGEPVSAATRAAIAADAQARREVNFIVNVTQPTYTTVAVDFTFTAYPGWDPAVVRTAAIAAAQNYLSPANWGEEPFSDGGQWLNEPLVAFLEVAEILNRVPGLRRLKSISLNGQPNADVALAGRAPLPRAGAITAAHAAS